MKPASALILVTLASLSSADAAWQKLPAVEKRVVETATSAVSGTKLESSKGIGQADALMSDDPTLPVTLSAGSSEAVLNLGAQHVIETVSFVNDSIDGKVVISGSGDKSNWAPLGQGVFTPADRNVQVSFAGSQIKYVKVQFELARGGAIRNFQLFGGDTDKDFEVQQNDSGKGGVKMNLANGMGGSRVVYVHPSPARDSDITEIGRAQSKFDFPATDEKYRTIIYDLGTPRVLSEFGSVHSPRPVRLEVFAFEQLPEKEDWRGRMSFDPKAFDSSTPVASKEDAQGLGYIKVKTQKPVRARYVALRWEPDFGNAGGGPFGVSGMNISGGGFNPANFTGGGGGGGGTGGGGGGGSAGPNNPYNGYSGAMSPFSFGTGGYAGGGGSLPPSSTTSSNANGNANGNSNGNSNGTGNGNANGNANGTPVASP